MPAGGALPGALGASPKKRTSPPRPGSAIATDVILSCTSNPTNVVGFHAARLLCLRPAPANPAQTLDEVERLKGRHSVGGHCTNRMRK